MHLLRMSGVKKGDLPKRYGVGAVIGYVLRQLTMLTLILPIAVVGAIFWAVPYLLTDFVASRFRPEIDQAATYKLAVAILLFPLWLAASVTGAWIVVGWVAGLAMLVAAPVCGLAVIAWRERGSDVLEDVTIFMRTVRRGRAREELSLLRKALVEDFDTIGQSWREVEDG
jgi:hypothetical protein